MICSHCLKKICIFVPVNLLTDDNIMRILASIILFILASSALYTESRAQTPDTDRFAERYSLLVSRLGADGVGIETLLDAWEAEDSTDIRLYTARFNYYFAKSRTSSVVTRPERKYLGMEPILHLKDSTGAEVYYYEEYFYSDSLFSLAIKTVDKAMKAWPDRLDVKLMKADALNAYEKGSPDMTSAFLETLAEEYFAGGTQWEYPGDTVDDDFVKSVMQQYCASFFNQGTDNSFAAFRRLAEKMLDLVPEDPTFMADMGSYMLVAEKDYKGALKWYNKVLKVKPDDYTAIKNCILVARRTRNTKLEKKYLAMMAEYGPENERQSAAIRLRAFEKKR